MKVTQLCLTLCDPMDSIVHGILQATIMEWVVFLFSREYGDLPNPGIKPRSPTLQADSLPAEPPGKPPRVKVNLLGISKLKWTGMGEFNSDDHYIYYCGQESLRRNGVAIIVNKSPKCNTWMQSQKWQNDLCFQGKPFNITLTQVYAPTSNAEEAEVEWFYEDL